MARYFSELTNIMKMLKDYMELISNDYKVQRILYTPKNGFEFEFREAGDTYTLYVRDGEIFTEDGQKCLDIMKIAYDNEPDMLQAINNFENKWMELKAVL